MEPEQVIRSALTCGGLLNASVDQGVFVLSADQHICPEASGQLIFALEADQQVGLITALDSIGTIQADFDVDVGGQQFIGQADLPGFDAEVLEGLEYRCAAAAGAYCQGLHDEIQVTVGGNAIACSARAIGQISRNKEPSHLADPGALETLIPALNHVSSTEGELEGLPARDGLKVREIEIGIELLPRQQLTLVANQQVVTRTNFATFRPSQSC